jgi:hypothetical protein
MGLVIYREPKQERQEVYYFLPTLQYNASVPKITFMNFRQDTAQGLGRDISQFLSVCKKQMPDLT